MPALRRFTKQILYAGLAIFIVAAVIILLILPRLAALLRGENQPDLPPPVAIKVESVDSVVHANSVDVVARIRNPNARAGVANYTIDFVLLDGQGQELNRIQKETYLLPGSLNYIAAIDIPLVDTLAQVKVETLREPVFISLPEGTATPTFNSFLSGRLFRTIGSVNVEEQKGIITNTSTLGYSRIDVNAVAFNAADEVVGISTTFIGQLQVGEQREVTLQWPAPTSQTTRVIMLPSTNIYQPSNVLEPRGDPGRLRDELEEGTSNSGQVQAGQDSEAAQ